MERPAAGAAGHADRAQLTAGFLLTLPFQSTFQKLDTFQTTLYLALVVVAALTTAQVMAPVAIHRRLSGEHVKERLVGPRTG